MCTSSVFEAEMTKQEGLGGDNEGEGRRSLDICRSRTGIVSTMGVDNALSPLVLNNKVLC